MTKPIPSFVLLSVLAGTAQAGEVKSLAAPQADQVRLVISGDVSGASAHSMSRASTLSSNGSGLSIITVDKHEADAMIQLLEQQPGVRAVERDLITSNPPMPTISLGKSQKRSASGTITQSASFTGSEPNDPEYSSQYTWQTPTTLYQGQHDVLNAYKKSTRNRTLRIGMTDSGFYDREDINYAGGYNFSTVDGNTVSPLFFEDEYNPSCDSPHGGAVAHIIGANTDNGVGVAGMVDAELFGVRVMNCGSGYLSEMATGFRWLAGDTSLPGDITPIDKPVHMINASMGAPSVGVCPSYVQDAINFAYNRGIAVFVAAGNDSINANDYTPANCDNVITVASVDRQGDQSSFTNFGPKIDVSALGEMVKSEGTTGYRFWYGTSFATPNTVGMAALALQASPSMTVDELYNYVKTNTRSYGPGSTSEDLGSGILDANQLMTSVNADLLANLPQLNPAMDTSERCQEAALAGVPFNDDNGNSVQPCAIFELDTTFVDPPSPGYENRSLYRIPQGGSYEVSGAELVKASTQEKFIAYNLDPETYDYGYAACDGSNTTCESSTLIPLNDDAISSLRYCVSN